MSDETTKSPREELPAGPLAVIARLPAMGKVMLTARRGGATHERIGDVTEIGIDGLVARLGGDCHAARIDAAVALKAVADRTGKMQDRALPRVDFETADGDIAFSVIALDGLEPFEAALEPLGAGDPRPERVKPAPNASEVGEDDPGAAPLAAAQASGREVTIELTAPGLVQSWRGVIASVKPAMGFINVMQPDFHLHLRGGAVARWRRVDAGGAVTLLAEDAAGAPTGLALHGSAAAFGA
jgi:putative heme degradation protein